MKPKLFERISLITAITVSKPGIADRPRLIGPKSFCKSFVTASFTGAND